MNDILLRQGLSTAAEASATALWGIGLFLIFFYVAQVRPQTKPWTSTAAMVLLATGLTDTVLRWVEFRNLSALMSGPPTASLVLVLEITGVLLLATALVGSTATVVALFGLTRPPNSG